MGWKIILGSAIYCMAVQIMHRHTWELLKWSVLTDWQTVLLAWNEKSPKLIRRLLLQNKRSVSTELFLPYSLSLPIASCLTSVFTILSFSTSFHLDLLIFSLSLSLFKDFISQLSFVNCHWYHKGEGGTMDMEYTILTDHKILWP